MHRLLALFLFAGLLFAGVTAAQDFTFEPPDTMVLEGAGYDVYIFHCALTNNTDTEQIYVLEFDMWNMILPENWGVEWCTKTQCYPPHPSPGGWTTVTDTLAPGETDDLISVDIIAFFNPGDASVSARVYDADFPDQAWEGVFMLDVFGTGVGEGGTTTAREFTLQPVYPNPFNPSARIGWTMPMAGTARVTVHDILGRELTVLADRIYEAGPQAALLHGRDLRAGTYFVRVEAAGQAKVTKATLVK